jgi:hypothetical protein
MPERKIGETTVHWGTARCTFIGLEWIELIGGWCIYLSIWPRRFGVHLAWWSERIAERKDSRAIRL